MYDVISWVARCVKGVGGVDVLNHYYNRSNIGLGAYTGAWGSSSAAQAAQDKYTSRIESAFPSAVQNYDQVPTALEVYTKALSAAANGSVVIASIGELTNLRDILLADRELFVQKVKSIV